MHKNGERTKSIQEIKSEKKRINSGLKKKKEKTKKKKMKNIWECAEEYAEIRSLFLSSGLNYYYFDITIIVYYGGKLFYHRLADFK